MAITKKAKVWSWAGGIIIALVIYDLVLGLWGSAPPKRPRNVTPDAVFISAPSVGWIWPLPKHGDWLNCWFDGSDNMNRCRMSDVDGNSEYEGSFLRYTGSGPLSGQDLQIDTKATGTRLQWLYSGQQLFPIIHLRNGIILLPAEAFEEGKHHLQQLQHVRGQ